MPRTAITYNRPLIISSLNAPHRCWVANYVLFLYTLWRHPLPKLNSGVWILLGWHLTCSRSFNGSLKGPISLSSECLRTLRIWIRQLFWRMLAKISDIKWRLATISNIWANVSESVCERQLATISDCKQMLATTFAKINNYLPILCHYLWTFETFC